MFCLLTYALPQPVIVRPEHGWTVDTHLFPDSSVTHTSERPAEDSKTELK